MAQSKRQYLDDGRPLKKTEDLDDRTFERLVARRIRALSRKYAAIGTDDDLRRTLDEAAAETTAVRGPSKSKQKKIRKSQEDDISQYYEKVHQEADFLPVRFLMDGAARAEAVCRMAVGTPEGKRYTGTGFLIAPGYLLTNNHVLKTRGWAELSIAIFDYEDGKEPKRVGLEPDRFFLTHAQLDFTIVACDTGRVAHIQPIPLLQNPALITRGERVYIIQHPAGRRKEVVLRNNEVTRVKKTVVQYRADTEGGSSGSPVFNEDWQLVALHHAGWKERFFRDRATNEGISIPAIVRFLQGSGDAEHGSDERAIQEILGNVVDTSPFLGFFDIAGAFPSFEVSIDSFAGTADFADVGFWNIEHFRDSVSDSRVTAVADVVSRLSLDLFGLTEVQRGALDRLVAEMAGRGDSLDYVYEDAGGSQDIAILYDQDTSVVTRLTDLYDRHARRLNARTRSGKTAFPRRPLMAECLVQESAEDTPVHFVMIVVHLKAFVDDRPSQQRRALAAQMLSEIVEDIQNRMKLPVIIGGDFNELVTRDVLRPLTGGPDLFALTTDDARDGGISYVGDRHRSLIDHIIVSRDVPMGRIRGDDAAIVRLDRSVADFLNRASDHVPLVMRMVYREEPEDVAPAASAGALDIPEGASKVSIGFE